MTKKRYVFDGISLNVDSTESDAIARAEAKLRRAGVKCSSLELTVCKKSVDARKKEDIRIVSSVIFSPAELSDKDEKKLASIGARAIEEESLEIRHGEERMTARPLVVGMGPAGMFCALILAEQGYRPIIIDRGDPVNERAAAVERFYKTHVLDTESNIQFGAGGAGTFSDGKLLTRINDPKCAYVLDMLAKFGAPEEIRVKAKPHVGTDVLRQVVDNVLCEIERLGGEVIYRCRLTDICELPDGNLICKTTKGDINASCAVLALGHSARDTYRTLIEKQFDIIAKPISVGVRIEHKRSFIEEALYGRLAGHKNLGAAEYALSDTRGERGVYTFCMCPGGEVMAAASEEGGVVVNGMSHYARDGENSNSAIAVSVRTEDFSPVDGSLALGAIEFQRRIERAAYAKGGGGFAVPLQTVGDFMRGVSGSLPSSVKPTYMNGTNYKCASMDEVLPDFVCSSLRSGLESFDKKIKGFASDDAILLGAETRTSSPLRILRGENMTALGKKSIYPCGEGAGYAGGITSAAVDGVKTAMAIISRFSPLD